MKGMFSMEKKSQSKNNENSVVDGVLLCVKCGSDNTTILKKGLYCRDCRGFRVFQKKEPQTPESGRFDDDD